MNNSVKWLPPVRFFAAAFCFVLSEFAGGSARAADLPDAPPVEVFAKFVHVTKGQARKAFGPWLGADGVKSDIPPEQVRKALKSLKEQKADFFSSPRLVAQSGSSATADEVREMRYPTEFNPSKEEPGKFIPVAFETRNTGVMLKVEAGLADGQMRVKVTPKFVRFLGFMTVEVPVKAPPKGVSFEAVALKRGFKEGEMYQPVFDIQQADLEIPLDSTETMAVSELSISGVAKEAGLDDVRTFVFVTARSLPQGGQAPAKSSPQK